MANHVLIVDDEPSVCQVIHDVLESVELKSESLTNSGQAAVRIVKEKFSAIFVDIQMPEMDGIELTRRIRASVENRTTPVVVITGDDDHGVLARVFDAGANFFLFKPIDRRRLVRVIRMTEALMLQDSRRVLTT